MWPFLHRTECTKSEHLWEHKHSICLEQAKKTGLAEHCVTLGHQPVFDSNTVISREERCWNRISGEAVTIQTDPHLVNRDIGLKLDHCWRPIIQLIRELKVNELISG